MVWKNWLFFLMKKDELGGDGVSVGSRSPARVSPCDEVSAPHGVSSQEYLPSHYGDSLLKHSIRACAALSRFRTGSSLQNLSFGTRSTARLIPPSPMNFNRK